MFKVINAGVGKEMFLVYNTNNIKNKCFICGAEIKNSPKRYEIYGNSCGRCSRSAGMKAKYNHDELTLDKVL